MENSPAERAASPRGRVNMSSPIVKNKGSAAKSGGEKTTRGRGSRGGKISAPARNKKAILDNHSEK